MIAELVDDPAWPEVTATEPGDVELLDLGTGRRERVPRAARDARRGPAPDPRAGLARVPAESRRRARPRPGADHDTFRTGIEWYHLEGCGHLSVEAFWQMSKVVEVRYDRFLASGAHRADPLAGS